MDNTPSSATFCKCTSAFTGVSCSILRSSLLEEEGDLEGFVVRKEDEVYNASLALPSIPTENTLPAELLCESNCNRHGVCINGSCACFQPWGGPACSVELTSLKVHDFEGCVDNCRGNGVCSEGVCECFEGFSGEICEDQKVVEEQSNGVCPGECGENSECYAVEGLPHCECSKGYYGKLCKLTESEVITLFSNVKEN